MPNQQSHFCVNSIKDVKGQVHVNKKDVTGCSLQNGVPWLT